MTAGTAVIRVSGLAKRYRLGAARGRPETVREAVTAALRAPFRRRGPDEVAAETLWALREVSFEVAPGEVVGLIGHNGAGKSTLLKVLARITRPTAGRIEIRGRVGALLEMGTGFNRDLTGRENIFLNGVILGMSRAEVAGKLDEIVAFAGVERFLDTPVKHYSSGMYVRLAFSVAAHFQPEILLFDEVLAVGDVEFQRKCIGRLERVARAGRTVILVSHHLTVVRALCHRALLLAGGRLVRTGPAEEVVEAYLGEHAATAADQAVAAGDHLEGVREIRLRRVTLLDGVAGQFVVFWRQPIRLRLAFEALGDLDDVSFGVGIRALDGSSIVTVHHDDDAAERWTLAAGEYAVDLEVENTLRPGLYRLHVGADQGGIKLRNLLAVETIHLEVLGHTREGLVAAGTNTGYVNGRSTWRSPQAVEAPPPALSRP